MVDSTQFSPSVDREKKEKTNGGRSCDSPPYLPCVITKCHLGKSGDRMWGREEGEKKRGERGERGKEGRRETKGKRRGRGRGECKEGDGGRREEIIEGGGGRV